MMQGCAVVDLDGTPRKERGVANEVLTVGCNQVDVILLQRKLVPGSSLYLITLRHCRSRGSFNIEFSIQQMPLNPVMWDQRTNNENHCAFVVHPLGMIDLILTLA